MSTVTSQRRRELKESEPQPVEILAWPLVQWGRSSALAVLAFAAVVVLVGLAGGTWLALAAVVVLAAAVWRFWLPTGYRLGPEGITRSLLGRRLRIPWRAVVRYRVFPAGVMLYYSSEPVPLAVLHGVYIDWTDCREPIMQNVAYYVGRQARMASSSLRRVKLETTATYLATAEQAPQ